MTGQRNIAGGDPLADLRKSAIRSNTPLWVHLDLTFKCNLKCIHCYLPCRLASRELSTVEWKKVMDGLAAMGTLFLTFSGGEILMRSDLFELVRHAFRKRFALTVFTNGVLIDERKADILSGFPFRQIGVSVYSMDPAVHDSMTGVPGSLAKTVPAVEKLASAGHHIVVKTIITRINSRGYGEIEKWARSLGPKVGFQYDMLVTPRLDGSHRETELNLDDRRRVSFLREHSKDRNAGDRMEGLEKGRPARRKSDTPCYAGQTGAYIGPTGEVHPCLDWLVDCGNVRHTPFAKIWKESEGMLFARGFKLGAMKKCMECGMVGSCSICPGLNDQENRDPAIPSVLVCARARAAFQVGKGLKK